MRDRHETYRLTLDDETRAIDAMRKVCGDWTRSGAPRATSDRVTLRRVGAHAIGCTLTELRTVEIVWLNAKAAELLEQENTQ